MDRISFNAVGLIMSESRGREMMTEIIMMGTRVQFGHGWKFDGTYSSQSSSSESVSVSP